jgi:hypothetical protein
LIIISIILSFIGCTKQSNVLIDQSSPRSSNQIPANFFANARVPGIGGLQSNKNSLNREANIALNDTTLTPDNGDSPVILGNKLTNPYSLSNMQTAYNSIYGSGTTLVPNHLYVRLSQPTQIN